MFKSNFEFITLDAETGRFFQTLNLAEHNYSDEDYNGVLVKTRTSAEHLARLLIKKKGISLKERATFNDVLRALKNHLDKIAMDSFYLVKNAGNLGAHELSSDDANKSEALRSLKEIFFLMVWYLRTQTDAVIDDAALKEFLEPQAIERYRTAERKFIYIQSVDNSSGLFPAYDGALKIGEGSIQEGDLETDWSPNSTYLRSTAPKRISQYMTTAGLPYELGWVELAWRKSTSSWFHDKDVHRVLKRSGFGRPDIITGSEWFKVDLDTAKRAIRAVKEGRNSLETAAVEGYEDNIKLRPSQFAAISQTKAVFKTKQEMLWNAKMRFGKTLASLQLIKDEKYKRVLLMTHRPVVKDSWFDDFYKMKMNESGYKYGSQNQGETLEKLKKGDSPFIYFASIQFLRYGGGNANLAVFADVDWDLVIVDEAHEGTQTWLSDQIMQQIIKPNTKVLKLSGTPFNLLDQFDSDQVYTWDYTMEQEAKIRFSLEHPDENNPYGELPKVSMYTFEMNRKDKFSDISGSFNFREFFRVDDSGRLVYEKDVSSFLDHITTPSKKTDYPFSTKEYREELRHTLWLMPGIKETIAFEKLLKQHHIFGNEYKIINVVHDGDDEATQDDLSKVRSAIGDDPSATKTITLTVRKLTTGVNIPEWTGIVFLSNTNSPMNYLQAAFRAQTPFSHEKLGKKENCYIFDFAPDRALTVMATVAQVNSGVGKKNTQIQKDAMTKLLNFMPILGQDGNGMKLYNVDKMLTQLKKVYAEKAVRSGFEDDSLYNDYLLTVTAEDADMFKNLQKIVGKTRKERTAKIVISDNGLTDEEYDTGEKAKKKNPRERTPEEKEALEKIKKAKNQRQSLISILRGVSIRIPMMIYGMQVELDHDITIKSFIDSVDEESWAEFMPKGFTKELFRDIAKYYDPEVFIEAGRIIRRRAKSYDRLDIVERAEKIAELFGTFKNPDKETVLTPWRVVNLQIVKSVGGFNFFDDNFENTTSEGRYVEHWVNQQDTDEIYRPDSTFLDINAKTGLYPLHVAMSLYQRRVESLESGKFKPLEVYEDILKNQVFAIAKTPMAKTITQRTLAGYRDLETNIEYIEGLSELIKKDLAKGESIIKETFGPVRFDVVIGNPPYQEESIGDSTKAPPIYHKFMEISYSVAEKAVLITPARFLFNAGGTPVDFNKRMLDDGHIKVIYYEQDSAKIFPNTDIKGGVAVTYRDAGKEFGAIGTFISSREMESISRKVDKLRKKSLTDIISGRGAYRLTEAAINRFPEIEKLQSKGHKYDIGTGAFKIFEDILFFEENPGDDEYIKILGLVERNRKYFWINKNFVNKPANLDKYKVIIPKSNGSGVMGEIISTPLIGKPLVGFTETFISIGEFESFGEAENCLKYIKTKFCRSLLGVLKVTQDNTREKWSKVPMQDFASTSDVPWGKSIPEIDQYLYEKYGLSKEEIDFLETRVTPME